MGVKRDVLILDRRVDIMLRCSLLKFPILNTIWNIERCLWILVSVKGIDTSTCLLIDIVILDDFKKLIKNCPIPNN